MSDKEITQGQDLAGEPNEEREEDGDGGDPEEDLALSEEERLVRQRASHEARRKRAKTAVKKGLVIVNTGKSKGKTTAAMGLLLRAWGQGLRVCMLQFIKVRTANWGKRKRLAKWAWR
jgi:cob(I)alamin adenosyltransferase